MDYSKGAFRSETGRTRAQTRTHHGKATSPTQRPRSDAGRAGQRTHAHHTIDSLHARVSWGGAKGAPQSTNTVLVYRLSHSLAAASSPIAGTARRHAPRPRQRTCDPRHEERTYRQTKSPEPTALPTGYRVLSPSLPLTPPAPRLSTASAVQGRQRS